MCFSRKQRIETARRLLSAKTKKQRTRGISLAPLENWGAHTSIETPGCEATGSAEFLRPKMSVLGGTGGFADILMHFSVTCNYGGVGTLMQV